MGPICLESEWQNRLVVLKWNESAISKYKHCLAKSSLYQYNRCLDQFYQFCIDKVGSFPPSREIISAVIADFLVHKCEHSDRPESLLKTISASITNFFMTSYQVNPFTVELKNLMKALIRCETKRPAGRTKVMPLEPLIRMFESWGPNESLSISRLRQKSIGLLAIACMARPSDFAPETGFKRDQIMFNSDGSVTILFFGVKNDSSRLGFEVRVESDPNPVRDPVSCLKTYFSRTFPTDNSVFVSLSNPQTGLSTASIAKIMKTCIVQAGLPPDTYTARCFRPSAATGAILSGCNPETTRLRGRWKENTTFSNRYIYPISNENITEKILSSNVNV